MKYLLSIAALLFASTSYADDYSIAYAQWQKSDKPLVVWYSMPTCPPCKIVQEQYETHLRAQGIVVHIDTYRDRAAILYNHLPPVNACPTIIVYPPRHGYPVPPPWHNPTIHPWPHVFVGVPGVRVFVGK